MSMAPTMMPQPGGQVQADPQGMDANMQAFAEQTGRGGDSVMAHLTVGEIVVPIDAQSEEVLMAIKKSFEDQGIDPLEFVVGMAQNKINPQTGNPEFFFSSLKKKLKKVRNKIKKSKFLRTAIPMVASAFLPMLAPTLMANPLMAAGANYTANRLVGNDHKSSLMGAAAAGVGTGMANKAAGSTFMGGSAPASTNILGNEVAAKTAIADMTTAEAGANMFGSGVPGSETLSNLTLPGGSTTLGSTNAGTLTGAAGGVAGNVTTAGAQSAMDSAAEQEALAAAALAKFNKPLPQLTEAELRELMNDPLNRPVDGGIYNYA